MATSFILAVKKTHTNFLYIYWMQCTMVSYVKLASTQMHQDGEIGCPYLVSMKLRSSIEFSEDISAVKYNARSVDTAATPMTHFLIYH